MRRGARGVALALPPIVMALLATAPAAGARVRVSMRPSTGHPTTRFVISFRSPGQIGGFGTLQRREVLSASGPTGQAGCLGSVSLTLRAARQGRRVRVTLNPRRLGGVWCVGRYRGTIVETEAILCDPLPAIACPEIVIAPRTIARFSFRVKAAPGGGTGGGGTGGGGTGPVQTQGPTFAGLESAVTCDPPIIRPGVTPIEHSYALSWAPATDPVTPSSQIVYEIFYSATSGGEDYATPTWVTSPGATTFTATVTPSAGAYFVVRARDQAGLVDQNTVQREGINECFAP